MKERINAKIGKIGGFWAKASPPYYDLWPLGVWAGDEDYAAYVCPRSGKLLGYYRHDGHGKWDITVYVSLLRAWRILRTHSAGVASWAPFPRCAVWMYRMKSQHSARLAVEELSDFDG